MRHGSFVPFLCRSSCHCIEERNERGAHATAKALRTLCLYLSPVVELALRGIPGGSDWRSNGLEKEWMEAMRIIRDVITRIYDRIRNTQSLMRARHVESEMKSCRQTYDLPFRYTHITWAFGDKALLSLPRSSLLRPPRCNPDSPTTPHVFFHFYPHRLSWV